MRHAASAIQVRQPEEALEISAPLARRLAPQLCRRDPATGENCAWNHGFWQYMRILGLAIAPEHHASFLRDAIARHRSASPRLLVSGTSDYAMLAQLLALFRAHGGAPAITVLDRCETSLMLNRWYAERAAANIETRCDNILEYSAAAPYDLICTHGFFGYFEPGQRQALLAKWHALLRPGGQVITVNRLRTAQAPARTGFDAQQTRAFLERVREASAPVRHLLDLEPEELALAAQAYAAKQGVYTLRSLDEVRCLFEETGFVLERLYCEPISTGARHPVDAPTVPGSDEYVHIVATRR
jgi:SAM-dependent methyltransferase